MIPFLDLGHVNRQLQDEISAALERVARSGWYILGNELRRFEESFATYCGATHCIGVANGSQAIELIFRAYDFPKGSEILVPANTYVATILPLSALGLTPVLVEPDWTTMLIDSANLQKHITPKTQAILAVHLYGRCAEINPLKEVAGKFGLKLVCDAAQAHGARLGNLSAGNLADAEAFSFYPTKNLGAMGDAGAVTTSDDSLAEKIKLLRNYGMRHKADAEALGINSRLDEMQAAILSVKLPHLDTGNDRRRKIAARYLSEINCDGLLLPPGDRINDDAWHLFVARHAKMAALRNHLTKNRIETQMHYPKPLHHQKAYSRLRNRSFPITEKICQQVFSLPLNTVLTDNQVSEIIGAVNSFY